MTSSLCPSDWLRISRSQAPSGSQSLLPVPPEAQCGDGVEWQ